MFSPFSLFREIRDLQAKVKRWKNQSGLIGILPQINYSQQMIPKVTFRYNSNYDLIYRLLFEEKLKNDWCVVSSWGEKCTAYPSSESTKERIQELRKWRAEHGDKMLTRICELLGCGRNNAEITCLGIGYCHLFWWLALPFTINLNYPSEIDFLWSVVVVHEIIHILQQSRKEEQKIFDERIWALGLTKELWVHALVFALQDVLFQERWCSQYFKDLRKHYEGREEIRLFDFLETNWGLVLINEYKNIK